MTDHIFSSSFFILFYLVEKNNFIVLYFVTLTLAVDGKGFCILFIASN